MKQINDVTMIEIDDGIAVLSIDSPPVNALSLDVMEGIDIATLQLLDDPAIRAIVLMCKGRTFIAGADIKSINNLPANRVDFRQTQRRIELSDIPFVAAIHGTALGGGLETAMAFHFRVAVPSARLGLPEVKLGLLPGGGGTQRLPRLVGARAALDMMTTGEQIDAAAALSIELIDEIVPEGQLREGAIAFARKIVAERRPLKRISTLSEKINVDRAQPELFEAYRREHAARLHGIDAAQAIVRCVEAAVNLPFDEGALVERTIFDEVRGGLQNRAMLHNFFAEREAAKIPGLAKDAKIPAFGSTLVLGRGELASEVAALVERGCGSVVRSAQLTDAGQLAGHDLIIEAGDDEAQGVALLAKVGASSRPGVLVATFAASERIETIASDGSVTSDVVGLRMTGDRLIEVARGKDTPPPLLAAITRLFRKASKVPVVALARPGLIVGRFARAVDAASTTLRERGTEQETIDRALRDLGLAPPSSSEDEQPVDGQVERFMLAEMAAAGRALLAEGIAWRSSDIDCACVNGLGFPAYRGGPMFIAEQAAAEA